MLRPGRLKVTQHALLFSRNRPQLRHFAGNYLHNSQRCASSTGNSEYTPLDAHNILQVSPKSSFLEKREAYLKLSAKFHPDKNSDDKHAIERFHNIQMAWQEIQAYKDKHDPGGMQTFVCPETHVEIKYDYEVKPIGAVETETWKSDIDTIRNKPMQFDTRNPAGTSRNYELGDIFFVFQNANLWNGLFGHVRTAALVLTIAALLALYNINSNGILAQHLGIATPEFDYEKNIVAHDPSEDGRRKLLDLKVQADLRAGKYPKGITSSNSIHDNPQLRSQTPEDEMTEEEELAEMHKLLKESLGK